MTPTPLRNDCFALPAGVHWTPVDEALGLLQDRVPVLSQTEDMGIAQANGRYLAQPVLAHRDHPPVTNSAVDGYGLCGDGQAFELVAGRAAAGQPFERSIANGQAVRILTGAPVPAGVDRIALQEDVTATEKTVEIDGHLKSGANMRAAGEDIESGDILFPAHHRMRPQDIGVLASSGVSQVSVFRPLRVAVLSTGDEVFDTGRDIRADQIFDANRPMLLAMIAQWGFEPVDIGIIPDDAPSVRAALDRAAAMADVIFTSGGASAGDEDHIARALNETGSMALWRIAIKPGRPLALGVWRGAPVFGLPGNPVAAFVCSAVFARPALTHMAGGRFEAPLGMRLSAEFSKTKKAGRREFLRARRVGCGVEVFASEGSGRISGLSWADGLVELPDQAMTVSHGDPVRFIPFTDFGLT